MGQTFRHHSWLVSPYSAKTRSYLQFKQIPHVDVVPSALMLMTTIRTAVGRAIMPTVLTPEGEWLQDSSEIIDTLEARFPEPSISPPGPTQRVASLLLELHADEWLPMVAMHSRWNVPGNAAFAIDEFARAGLPWVPRFLGRRLIRPLADKMRGYRPILGVDADTGPGIEAFAQGLIAQLEAHFETLPFLLGTRPCLGDCSLFGPLWSHVYRDPHSRHWFDDAPHVVAWFERLLHPDGKPGVFLPGDVVPETLDPVFAVLFGEQWPFIRALAEAMEAWAADHPDATRVPRSLGSRPFVVGGSSGTRRLITFTGWMAQRPLDAYAGLDPGDKARVDTWLDRVGAPGALDLQISPRQTRRAFVMGIEPGAAR